MASEAERTSTSTPEPQEPLLLSKEPSPSPDVMNRRWSETIQLSKNNRLRESCNQCALSKVRCSKDRPRCRRCSQRDMYCYYAPSRRNGKRRAWSPSLSGQLSARDLSFGPMLTPPETQGLNMSGFITMPDAFDFSQKQSRYITSQPHLQQMPDEFHARMYTSHPYMAASNRPMSSDSLPGSDVCTSNPYMDMDFEEVNAIIGTLNSTNVPAPITPCSSGQNNSRGMLEDSCALSCSSNPQDCMSRALKLMKDLHMAPSTCVSMPSDQTIPQEAAPIDYVLSANKKAIDSIIAILNCSCALDIQLALVLTLVTSKIIAWYGAIAFNCNNNNDTTGISTETISSSTTERVLHQPISVGKYSIDEDSTGKMRAQLVLSEMHYVARLVEQLSKAFAELGAENPFTTPRSNGPASDSSIGTELQTYLQYRLVAVTKETANVLRKK